MSNKLKFIKKSKAFSLVEVFLVIGIFTLIASVAYMGYQKRKLNLNVDLAAIQIYELDRGIQNIFGTTKSFTQLSVANIKASGIIRPNNLNAAGDIIGPWGNIFSFAAVSLGGVSGYEISMASLTKEQCMLLASAPVTGSFMEVAIDATTVKPYTTPTINIDPGAIANTCVDGSTLKLRNLPRRVNFIDRMNKR